MRSPGCMVKLSLPRFHTGDHQLALVIGVDKGDQVAQHDAVLMAETGAGQDGDAWTWILDVDGKPGRHQRGVAEGRVSRASAGRGRSMPAEPGWRRRAAGSRCRCGHPGFSVQFVSS